MTRVELRGATMMELRGVKMVELRDIRASVPCRKVVAVIVKAYPRLSDADPLCLCRFTLTIAPIHHT